MTADDDMTLSCPAPLATDDTVQLAHGGGGRAMGRLLDQVIRPLFDDPLLRPHHDGAVVALGPKNAFTTDSYVVRPLIFPGGDIGSLAVNGTVNDLAMCGARPLFLSVGLILEEGLAMATLHRVLASMRDAAQAAGIRIVTGDTKVVDRGKADGMFINTAGIGQVIAPAPVEPRRIRPGDAVILSGDIGRHGIAVLAARPELGLTSTIESDCAPLSEPVLALFEAGIDIRCLRDLTRGGLASALVEIAETAEHDIVVDETAIPVAEEVRAISDLLGLDPLHIANEGRFVAFVAPDQAARAIEVLNRHGVAKHAVKIGEVNEARTGQVIAQNAFGTRRVIDMLSGEQLPRIC